jgi:hypothetical protein
MNKLHQLLLLLCLVLAVGGSGYYLGKLAGKREHFENIEAGSQGNVLSNYDGEGEGEGEDDNEYEDEVETENYLPNESLKYVKEQGKQYALPKNNDIFKKMTVDEARNLGISEATYKAVFSSIKKNVLKNNKVDSNVIMNILANVPSNETKGLDTVFANNANNINKTN